MFPPNAGFGAGEAPSKYLPHSSKISLAGRHRCSAVGLARLPAYAPELNPVEYVWGHLKKHALANFCPKDFAQLGREARRALRRAQCRPTLVRASWHQAQLSW